MKFGSVMLLPLVGLSLGAPAQTNAGPNYVDTINDFRSKNGIGPVYFSDQLQQNAARTGAQCPDSTCHILYPGTYAQILAPIGNDFREQAGNYWLCQLPDAAQRAGFSCSSSVPHEGDAQARILLNPEYTKLGCSFNRNYLFCDWGF